MLRPRPFFAGLLRPRRRRAASFSVQQCAQELARPAAPPTPSQQRGGSTSLGVWSLEKPQYVRRRRVDELPPADVVAGLTREMQVFMSRVQEYQPDPWFHRKSEKLVLAVVQVDVDGVPHFCEGMNAEVSLPTGAVCAERSAVLHARAKFPGLRRADFAGVAVLEVPLVPEPADPVQNPLQPCGACREWLLKLQEENPDFVVVTYDSIDMQEVEESFPDGRKGSDSDRLLRPAAPAPKPRHGPLQRSAEGVQGDAAPPRKQSQRLVSKLSKHWPPGTSFKKGQIRRKIPWFPMWWVEDLAHEGLLQQIKDGSKFRYEVSSSHSRTESAGDTTCKAMDPSCPQDLAFIAPARPAANRSPDVE